MSGVWLRISVIGWRSSCPTRHEHPRHQREVERHVALVAVAEVRRGRRPATGWPRRAACGRGSGRRLAARMRLRTACVSGRFSQFVPSRSKRYGTASSRSPSTPRSSQNVITRSTASTTVGVVVVQVRLVGEEAVPVVRRGRRVPGPVRRLGVGEDDARVLVALVGVAPDVEVALGDPGGAWRAAWNHGCWSEVWLTTSSVMHAQAALVRLLDEAPEVRQRAVGRVDALVVARCRSRRRAAATGRTAAARGT